MDNPTDRVTYGDLRLLRKEFEELMQMSLDAQTLKEPIAFERYVDESFVRAVQPTNISI
jgi:NitT/TauT family transport system substrate-binding protein